MKTRTITLYICDICGEEYATEAQAENCAAHPVQYSRGVDVGDRVRITDGQCAGLLLEVESIFITRPTDCGRDQNYWHAIALYGKVLGGLGHMLLHYNNYEKLPSKLA